MSQLVQDLDPIRWKVFQCLLIQGENSGENALRNAQTLSVSDADFRGFCERHAVVKCLVAESNDAMRNSYLILDEYMRFLDNTQGEKKVLIVCDASVCVCVCVEFGRAYV